MTTSERHQAHDVITLRAKLDAAQAEVTRLRAVLTSKPALEALMTPTSIHVIDLDKDITTRELEVLKHVSAGYSNDDIARKMFVSVSTVKTHLGNLFHKLGVHNRTAAVLVGIKLGLRTEVTL